MKTKLITTITLLILLSSCDNFLNVSPRTSINKTDFYQSKLDYEQAVTGIYAPLEGLYDSRASWALEEIRSDNTHFTFKIDRRGHVNTEHIATFLVDATNNLIRQNWSSQYEIISRANDFLSVIDQSNLDQSLKDNMKGQALFLRAFAYFQLVRDFGKVPIYLKPVISYEGSFKAQASVSKVYDQILTDTKTAVKLLPDRTNQDQGKVTLGAAYTLLGNVYLTQERWTDAETALKHVTKMNYHLLSNYADIFKPSNKYNDEMIFEIGFQAETGEDTFSSFPYTMLPFLNDASVITGVSRSQSNPNAGFNIPTPDLINAYEDTAKDQRFDASIGLYSGPSPVPGVPYDPIPYIKKYQHPHTTFGQTNQNWPVYRYAGLLLKLAEAINEQGEGLSEAKEYLDQVRNRAGLNNSTASSQMELRKAIRHESRIELAFENKRWNNLVRTGQAVKVMNAFGAKVKANPQDYYYPPNAHPASNSFDVTKNKLVYPIPAKEINLNPELNQNPGY